MELVETQKPRLVEDRRRGERDHVAVGDFAARDILTKAVNPLVNVGHEFVEVRAALALDRTVLKKQIHQHGLAAPDLAMNVEAAWRRLVLVGKQPAKQALLAQRRIARKPLLEVRERHGGLRLRGVGLDRPGGDEALIMGAERGGRGRQHGPFTPSTQRKLQAKNWCKGQPVMPAKAGIQYAAAFRFNHRRLWNTGSSAFADDDDDECGGPCPLRAQRVGIFYYIGPAAGGGAGREQYETRRREYPRRKISAHRQVVRDILIGRIAQPRQRHMWRELPPLWIEPDALHQPFQLGLQLDQWP